MEKIYSKVNPNLLLHLINRKEDIVKQREDLCEINQPIQVSTLNLPQNKTFKPHRHIDCNKQVNITQESWVVIQGKIEAILYDIDNTIIEEVFLYPGDCSITFYGGHNYMSLEENTLVYEYKTGPYLGQEKDKIFI